MPVNSKVLVFVLMLVAVFKMASPAEASHTPGATGCERAHECAYDYAEYLPPGYDLKAFGSIYMWNPLRSEWGIGGYYGAKALCFNWGGYYYQASDGVVYWNECREGAV